MDGSAAAGPGSLAGRPATEIAEQFRVGRGNAVDVVRAHLAQIDAVDRRIGAFRVVLGHSALAEAAAVDASPERASLPLAGAGLPALVLPAGPGRQGLPTAVQLIGPAGSERRLLWLAGELERRLPWRRHAPVFDPQALAGLPAG